MTDTARPEYRNYRPLSDPFNTSPPTSQGYPARLHSEGGEIFYYPDEASRHVALTADEYHLRHLARVDKRRNAPWWKKTWRRITRGRL